MPLPYHQRLARAEALVEIARYREAIAEFSLLLAEEPDDSYVFCYISMCYHELGEMRLALDFAKQGAEADPDYEWPFRLMSIIYMEMGESKKALEAAETAAELGPQHPYALQSLTYAQIEHFEYDEAEETAAVMLKIAPDQTETHDTLGYLAASRERFDEAEKHYERSLSINPESAGTMNALGSVYHSLAVKRFGWATHFGYMRKARDTYIAALKIDPTLESAQQNLEAIETHPMFWGGKANRIFFRLHLITLGLIIAARLMCIPIPDIVRVFTEYEDRIFTTGVNLLFVVSLIMWGQFFFRRTSRLESVYSYYYGKPHLEIMPYFAVVVLQIAIIGLILIMDTAMIGGGLLILIIAFCVIVLVTVQIHARLDTGVDD